MTPEEFSEEISDIVDKAVEKLKKAAGKSQKRIMADLTDQTAGFDLLNGSIKPTAENLKKLQSIRNKLIRTVANEEWIKAVKDFTDEMRVVELRVKTYMLAEFGNEFNFEKPVLGAIKENAIILTNQTMVGSGLSEKVTTQIEPILARSVTLGVKYSDLIEGMRSLLLENEGKLVRWVKQIAADQQHTFVRNYLQTLAQGQNNEWYKYSGGRVRETREFCSARMGKYWHISEIRAWADLEWQGKNASTTADNILTLAGGWNCLHLIIPVSPSQVPKERRAEFE